MKGRILDSIIENSDRHLDAVTARSAEYKRVSRELSKSIRRLEKVKLSRKQERAVDNVFTRYNEENACCCRLLYEQGFQDCVSLLKEIGMFR